MSGICGVIDFSGTRAPVLEQDLRRMLARASHLGPDGKASESNACIGIGQWLDYQTPESTALTQVAHDAETQVSLVADVRLDNREELGDKLGIRDAELRALPDEHLILRAYRRWGIDLVEHLLGDYFLALWSARDRTLWLVRDALGVRPGCYAVRPGGLMFATEVTALLACANYHPEPCRTRIADFIGIGFEERELTFYEGVLRLPPGTVLQATEQGVTKRRYYQLPFTPELRLRDNREYGEAFRHLLVDSVHRRLRSRVPTGFLLSGGLDSTSLVGIARQSGRIEAPLHTFSALFPDYPQIDERHWIEQVLATGSFEPSFVRVDQRTPLEHLEKEIQEHGEPFYAPNNYVDSALLDCARDAGMRLVLDGLDGDTTVGHGWEFMGELLRRGKLRRLLRIGRELSNHTDRSSMFFLSRHALTPTALGVWAHLRGRRAFKPPSLMRADFARDVGWVERCWGFEQQRGASTLSSYRQQHWAQLASGLLPMCFEIAARQAAVRGMGRRHPYFDRKLVEFCVSLPADQRLNRGADRLIQRRAVEGFTPENIRRRLTKSEWVQNFADRMRHDERPRIQAWLTKDSPISEYIEIHALRRECKAVLAGSVDQRALAQVWLACALDVWLNTTRRTPDN